MRTLKGAALREKADFIRNEVVRVSVANNAGHIAPSLSCLDILVALYYQVMSYKPESPRWDKRDFLIFSKAHGCYALYAILADLGLISRNQWKKFYTDGSSLKGCNERNLNCGLEAGCGSLGHGLPMAVGVAFASRLQRKHNHIFCVVGDGEMQEGSTWEAIQFAVKHELGNLTIIIDNNRLQAMDFIVNVLDKTPFDKINKLRGFGLKPEIHCGHDTVRLAIVLKKTKKIMPNLPKVVIARTIKGFGVKCMENVPKFHFRVPNKKELC
jgi:transketolase